MLQISSFEFSVTGSVSVNVLERRRPDSLVNRLTKVTKTQERFQLRVGINQDQYSRGSDIRNICIR